MGRERPVLMLVTDRRRSRFPLLEAIDASIAGGVDVVQIREKDLSAADRLALASRIVKMVRGRATVVINSDVAAAEHLRVGVHLPDQATEPPSSIRARLGEAALIGRSIHAPDARDFGLIDYLLLGNVFATPSKPGHPALGPSVLSRAAHSIPTPVWAIGGIEPANAAEVIRTGATGIAVIGAVLSAPDPEAAARALRAAIDDAANGLPVKPATTLRRTS